MFFFQKSKILMCILILCAGKVIDVPVKLKVSTSMEEMIRELVVCHIDSTNFFGVLRFPSRKI
jgi:hypothetical protein